MKPTITYQSSGGKVWKNLKTKDSERIDWLQKNQYGFEYECGYWIVGIFPPYGRGTVLSDEKTLRQAIDKAMKNEEHAK